MLALVHALVKGCTKIMLQPGTKSVLVYLANLILHDNCERGDFFITHPFKLYQALKFCIIKGRWIAAAVTETTSIVLQSMVVA